MNIHQEISSKYSITVLTSRVFFTVCFKNANVSYLLNYVYPYFTLYLCGRKYVCVFSNTNLLHYLFTDKAHAKICTFSPLNSY